MLTVLPHRSFTLRSYAPSNNIKGVISQGSATDTTVSGTISAAKPSDIAKLEEGKRTRNAFLLITESSLNTARQGGQVPDRIQVGSEWYEIDQQSYWGNQVMPHNEYIVVKIENP